MKKIPLGVWHRKSLPETSNKGEQKGIRRNHKWIRQKRSLVLLILFVGMEGMIVNCSSSDKDPGGRKGFEKETQVGVPPMLSSSLHNQPTPTNTKPPQTNKSSEGREGEDRIEPNFIGAGEQKRSGRRRSLTAVSKGRTGEKSTLGIPKEEEIRSL